MTLEKTHVEKIARLARLKLSDNDIPEYARQLSSILALVEQMNTVDTVSVAPLAHPQELGLRLRDDVVTEGDQREAFQAIAAHVESGLYCVPKVIDT
ncbi:MAG: Asp-tRNA(Asn)/Glu-tRNA(Gln) amidotransferase subunit GatC [Gammaproteobacteria bacterium]